MILKFYLPIFLLLSSLIAFMPLYKGMKIPNYLSSIAAFSLISIILIFRDVNAPVDMKSYTHIYSEVKYFNDIFNAYQGDVTFAFLMYLGKILNFTSDTFFKIMSILYLIIIYQSFRYIFSKKKHAILALVLFSLSSTFVLMFTNGLRQGLAIVLLVLFVGLFIKRKRLISYIVMILSIYSHSSVLPFIVFIFIASYFSRKNIKYKLLFILMPFLIFIGSIAGDILAAYFYKIQSSINYSNNGYDNKLVYVKVLVLYVFGILCYVYGYKYDNFKIYGYKLIFNIYLLSLMLVFITLPILFISSRFLYYPSALMPIMLTYLFFSRKGILNINYTYVVYLFGMLIYGYIVYSYPSVQVQLWET
jgi:hypothetical protein